MSKQLHVHVWCRYLVSVALVMSWALAAGAPAAQSAASGDAEEAAKAKLRAELKNATYRLVNECRPKDKWELHAMNADGSGAANLSAASGGDDLYAHASPDGTKICFEVDEGEGKDKSRNVYYMNADGSGRTLVARNARDGCWSPDGSVIAYTKGEFDRYTTTDFASKGVFFYDLKTAQHRQHPNQQLHHLYNICWSPDGKWMLTTVHGGMGYDHALLAFEVGGTKVFKLEGINGCRPDFSPDGKKMVWNESDQVIAVADLDLTGPRPKVTNVRPVASCSKEYKMYHADWSPDGKYIAFSYGPVKGEEQVGEVAKGWNICVADAAQTNVWIPVTSDGACNKEADWLPAVTK